MRIIGTAAFLLITFSGCYNDKYDKLYPSSLGTTTCDTSGTITYSGDIKPIIEANCYSPGNGCHDATGSAVSQYDYETSITALQTNAQTGLLLNSINWQNVPSMPKNGNKLPSCDIDKITRWVDEGAPNN
jgi:hypothetical protein